MAKTAAWTKVEYFRTIPITFAVSFELQIIQVISTEVCFLLFIYTGHLKILGKEKVFSEPCTMSRYSIRDLWTYDGSSKITKFTINRLETD